MFPDEDELSLLYCLDIYSIIRRLKHASPSEVWIKEVLDCIRLEIIRLSHTLKASQRVWRFLLDDIL